jgi:hypothetical protein
MQNSKAELFFERSKMILREIITEDMDDYAKALAIFDYLVDNVAYDYDAFYRDSSENSHTDVCYYLEGVFERGRAVCDGKSKAFVLLCGIEGIECVRDFGSKLSGAVGHAWNYVKLDGVWYLVDTTAADAAQSAENGFNGYFGKRIEMTVYDMFLADVSSHRDEYYYSPLFEYITDTNQINVNNTAVFTEKIFGTGYDFKMESKAELEMLIEIILAEDTDVGSECVLVVTLAQAFGSSSNAFSAIDKGISDSGSDAEYQIFTGTMSGVDILYITMKNV